MKCCAQDLSLYLLFGYLRDNSTNFRPTLDVLINFAFVLRCSRSGFQTGPDVGARRSSYHKTVPFVQKPLLDPSKRVEYSNSLQSSRFLCTYLVPCVEMDALAGLFSQQTADITRAEKCQLKTNISMYDPVLTKCSILFLLPYTLEVHNLLHNSTSST